MSSRPRASSDPGLPPPARQRGAAGDPLKPQHHLALVMWGDLFEDFFDTIDVSLERFRRELNGGWLFGYVEALRAAGVHTTLIHMSARVTAVRRLVHEPTSAPVVIIPAPRRHQLARALTHIFPQRKSLSSLASYASIPFARLLRELRRCQAEVILTQEYEHARFDLLVLLGKLSGRPVFATFQGGMAPHSRLERPVRGFTARASAGLVIGSRGERNRVQEAYGVERERVAPIPNPLSREVLQPIDRSAARRRLGLAEGTCVVEWHGRVSIRRKGLDVLLRAWADICRERPGQDLLLLLVGSGEDAAEFAWRLKDLALDTIRWDDHYLVDRTLLRAYQWAADIFVLPSRHEGFPVAPLEAMAAGLPVVAADAPGVEDILADGERSGGLVVPREDADALADALGRLIDDAVLRALLGRSARMRVEGGYGPEAIGNRLRAFMFRD